MHHRNPRRGGSRVERYIAACRELGLPALGHPLSVRMVGGREVYFATSRATDELAQQHRVHRELVQGPLVLQSRGDRIAHASCRASTPDGHSASAACTIALHSFDALMQCETRARRLATLRVLGLERYAESERETIPSGYEVVEAKELVAIPMELPATEMRAQSMQTVVLLTQEQHTLPMVDTPMQTYANPSDPMREIPLRTLVEPGRATVYVPGGPPLTTSDALTDFLGAVRSIEREQEAVNLWLSRRAGLASLPTEERTAAWEALCARVATFGRGNTAKAWLKEQINAASPP